MSSGNRLAEGRRGRGLGGVGSPREGPCSVAFRGGGQMHAAARGLQDGRPLAWPVCLACVPCHMPRGPCTLPTTPERWGEVERRGEEDRAQRRPSPALSPTDPVPRPTDPLPLGQLWPTGPIYSLYTAYTQPIYRVALTTRLPFAARERRVFCKTSIDSSRMQCVLQDLYNAVALMAGNFCPVEGTCH